MALYIIEDELIFHCTEVSNWGGFAFKLDYDDMDFKKWTHNNGNRKLVLF